MRLCFQRRANCKPPHHHPPPTSPSLLELYDSLQSDMWTCICANVQAPAHTDAPVPHACTRPVWFHFRLCKTGCFFVLCCLCSFLLCKVTCSQGERMLVLFSGAHDCHLVIFSMICWGEKRTTQKQRRQIFFFYLYYTNRTWDFTGLCVKTTAWNLPATALKPPLALKITTLQPWMASRPWSAHTPFHTLLPLALLLMCQREN